MKPKGPRGHLTCAALSATIFPQLSASGCHLTRKGLPDPRGNAKSARNFWAFAPEE